MDLQYLKDLPKQDWHLESRPELSSWLEHSPSTWSAERLKAIGNVVYPDMAAVALQLIGHELQGSN